MRPLSSIAKPRSPLYRYTEVNGPGFSWCAERTSSVVPSRLMRIRSGLSCDGPPSTQQFVHKWLSIESRLRWQRGCQYLVVALLYKEVAGSRTGRGSSPHPGARLGRRYRFASPGLPSPAVSPVCDCSDTPLVQKACAFWLRCESMGSRLGLTCQLDLAEGLWQPRPGDICHGSIR